MDLGSPLLTHLADASLRALGLALAAYLALWLARVRDVSMRHAVGTGALCAMLLLPALTPLLPPIPVIVLRQAEEVVLQATPPAPIAFAGAFTVVAPAPAPRWSWQEIALAVYLGIALMLITRLLVSGMLVRRLIRRCAPVSDPRARQVVERLAGGRATVLLESERISVPMTAGALRPRVLLPSGWREWSPDKLEAALAHELAHAQRRDPLVALVASLNTCVFWFHPLAWWMKRKLALLAEQAADDRALLILNDRRLYAATLVEMAAATRGSAGRLFAEGVAMARASQLRQRIDRVLDETAHVTRGVTKARWIVVALAGAAVLYGAAALQVSSVPVSALPQLVVDPAARVAQAREERLRKELETPYRRWVAEDAAYIITPEERDAFLRLATAAEREKFIEQFWLRRDPTPGTKTNEFKEEHYRRIAYAVDRFAWDYAGWQSDRGRIYIIYGPPDEVESHPGGDQSTPPYEIWLYRRIEGIGANVEFRFEDPGRRGEYRLSGEPANRIWP